ncbi:MAG: hypothetical protein ACFFD1_15375 [Candidatus Thorarchaeota archaeon]
MSYNTVLDYINTIKNPEKRKYALEVMELLKLPGRHVAYHAFCTDGAICAALLKWANEGDVFVPIDYFLIYDKKIGLYLSEYEWYAIVDLEPFNLNYQVDLYVDHHITVVGKKINAKRIHFETGTTGPSAASVLYRYLANKLEIPFYLTILAEMSKITDTASYKIPPLTVYYDSKNVEITKDEIDSEKFHQLIWDLQDALTLINKTATPNNICVNLLSENGLASLLAQEDIINRINIHRQERIKALDFAKSLNPAPLTIIINSQTRNIQDILVHYFTNKGAKIIASLKEDPFDKSCSLSLRQSKHNSLEEKELYRLDVLAQRFSGGGGHIEASGASSPNKEEALKILIEWAKEKGLLTEKFNVEGIK